MKAQEPEISAAAIKRLDELLAEERRGLDFVMTHRTYHCYNIRPSLPYNTPHTKGNPGKEAE